MQLENIKKKNQINNKNSKSGDVCPCSFFIFYKKEYVMFEKGFPIELKKEVLEVECLIPFQTYGNVSIGESEQYIQYCLNGDTICFPYRIYYFEIEDTVFHNLSFQKQMIAHCIYSRSCDGFVRQKHIEKLLLNEYESWAVPYIVKVCDEYVMEILESVYHLLQKQDTTQIKKFCLENTDLFCRSYARMISYWNEFYRDRCFRFHNYIGKKLFQECFGYTRELEKRK